MYIVRGTEQNRLKPHRACSGQARAMRLLRSLGSLLGALAIDMSLLRSWPWVALRRISNRDGPTKGSSGDEQREYVGVAAGRRWRAARHDSSSSSGIVRL